MFVKKNPSNLYLIHTQWHRISCYSILLGWILLVMVLHQIKSDLCLSVFLFCMINAKKVYSSINLVTIAKKNHKNARKFLN